MDMQETLTQEQLCHIKRLLNDNRTALAIAHEVGVTVMQVTAVMIQVQNEKTTPA